MRPTAWLRGFALATTAVAVLPAQALQGQAPDTLLAIRAARPSPAWVRNAVVYELNVRSFSQAGTLNAVTERLPELRQLGVTVVWLMPVHPVGQLKRKGTVGSPYAVRDYRTINPAYGTPEDFRRLVRDAHRLGLKVIIDLVANHTAWDNPLIRTPAFYRRDSLGRIVSPYDWSDVAALDYGNPAVRAYMTDVMEYWVREYDLDGFRADVAWLVPVDFWEQARQRLARIKPDIMLLAEAHEPVLLRQAFDLDYSWPLYHAIKGVVLGDSSAPAIRAAWEREVERYPRGALHLRFAENHDEDRAIALFGARGALAVSALVFTLDGVPLLYNGMEAGDVTESGAPALFEKVPIFWGSRERRPDLAAFYPWIIGLRRQHPALQRGRLEWVANSDDNRIVTFLRQVAGETILVAINLSNRPFVGRVEVPGAGYAEIARKGVNPQAAPLPTLSLHAWGFRIFRRGS